MRGRGMGVVVVAGWDWLSVTGYSWCCCPPWESVVTMGCWSTSMSSLVLVFGLLGDVFWNWVVGSSLRRSWANCQMVLALVSLKDVRTLVSWLAKVSRREESLLLM